MIELLDRLSHVSVHVGFVGVDMREDPLGTLVAVLGCLASVASSKRAFPRCPARWVWGATVVGAAGAGAIGLAVDAAVDNAQTSSVVFPAWATLVGTWTGRPRSGKTRGPRPKASAVATDPSVGPARRAFETRRPH